MDPPSDAIFSISCREQATTPLACGHEKFLACYPLAKVVPNFFHDGGRLPPWEGVCGIFF